MTEQKLDLEDKQAAIIREVSTYSHAENLYLLFSRYEKELGTEAAVDMIYAEVVGVSVTDT